MDRPLDIASLSAACAAGIDAFEGSYRLAALARRAEDA
jgi:hypothetical protein